MSEKPVVRYETEGDVGIVIIDYPPVNALGPGVREGIVEMLDKAIGDPAIKAIVMMGAGRSFIAGADIRQFGKARPVLTRTPYMVLEASPKPVVAAIHGFALGGGLETALACHYRIADAAAKVGLPEVLIGVLPGGGGTQRLPRLIGPKAALEMIVTGRHVPAPEAKQLGIVDAVVSGDLRAEAIRFARSVASKRPLPLVRNMEAKLAEAKADPGMFDAMRQSIARRARGQKAPYNCIACVEAAVSQPFDEGIATERRLFNELENSEEARSLRYAFFAEREINRIPGLPKDLKLPEIKTMAVVGAGTMGGGIAMSFADAGMPVKLVDASKEVLNKGLARIKANYATSVKRGSLAQAEMDKRMSLITPVETMADIGDCDAVIEAVFERMDVKKEVFKQLDAVMKLFEVVNASKTAPGTLAAAMKLGRDINKVSGYAGNCDGFVANRSRIPFNLEQGLMIEEGALPQQIDKVMEDFGYPVGPFKVNDMSGLDVSYDTRKRRKAADPNYRGLPITDAIVEAGRLGQKTGAGWYRYEAGDRTPHVDPELEKLVRAKAAELGIQQRTFSDQEILHRLLFGSINECCKILEEGKAIRASDIDVMWLHGFGFPRYKGGVMYWADTVGAREIYNQIAVWHQRYGGHWKPSRLLQQIAESGGKLREAKGKGFG